MCCNGMYVLLLCILGLGPGEVRTSPSWRGREGIQGLETVRGVSVPEWEMERTEGQVVSASRLWRALNTAPSLCR